jgi:uncharacterized repeat protein (TIGR01451 family)
VGVRARTLLRARARALAAVAAIAAIPAAAATPPGVPVTNTAVGTYVPAGGTGTVESRSNTVTTVVAALTTFEPLRLSVTPAGPVAPGTLLTYTITATNASGVALPDATFTLPFDSDLVDPEPPASSPGAPGSQGTLSPDAVWDQTTRTAVWTISIPIPSGTAVTLKVRARARPDATTDDTVVETAGAMTSLSIAPLASNTVVTPIVEPLLQIVKIADRRTIAPGDGVGFQLAVTHVGTATPLTAVVAVDTLPPQLRYVPGTTRVDGVPVADPAIGSNGTSLRFPLPDMPPGATHVIAFGARLGPTAVEGEIVNTAHAEAITEGGNALVSPNASAAVQIIPGPFQQESTVVGRVFVDDDGDGLPSPGEPGVPFALVIFEDGRGAVTDVSGRWHLEAVRPGLHVLRVDPGSLPPPLAASYGGTDWAGDRESRFLETRATGLAIADLPVGPAKVPRCTIASGHGGLIVPVVVLDPAGAVGSARARAVLEAAAAYVVDQGELLPGAVTLACEAGSLDPAPLQAELRGLVAERVGAVADTTISGLQRLEPGPEGAPPGAPGTAPSAGAAPAPVVTDPLEDLVRHAAPAVAIAYPADGARAAREFTNVEVVYPANSRLELTLNGDPVPMELVGATSTLPARGLSASRFIGVKLRQGVNVFELRATPVGADDASSSPVRSTIYLPGPTVELGIASVEARCVADGVTPCPVRIEGLDEGGMRAGDEPLVTVIVEGARPIDADADPRTEGLQVRVTQGLFTLRLTPPSTPGRIRVFAQFGRTTAEGFIDAVPQGGAWRVTGLAEGRVAGDGGVEGDGGLPPGLVDDISESGGRLALFAQGPVTEQSHLTVAIDTERKTDTYRLFDRFRPDAFFPVFGDSGPALDEAARQGPFFARLDGPVGFVAVGDFPTAFTHTELARYDRRLTGAWGRAGNAVVSFEGFAASTGQRSVRDTFSPDGTSGPYLLSRRPVVAYSETVIFEIRDRWRPEIVLHRIVKQPDLDYALDPEAGTILFRGPVSPFDPDLNPIDVVVLFEARTGASDQIAAGVRLVAHPTPRIDAGVTGVYEGHAGADLGMVGVDLAWRPAPGTTVAAESAATQQAASTVVAYRFEAISQASEALRWEAHYHDIPAGFANPSFLSAPEIGGKRASAIVTWQSKGPWRLKGDALWQNDEVNDYTRTSGAVTAERNTDRFSFGGAVRGVSFDNVGVVQDSLLLEAGVRARLAPRWTGELFHAQVVAGEVTPGYPNRTSIGVSWEIKDGRRFVLKHEIQSGGSYPTQNRTLVGLESRIGAHTRALVNYTLEGGAAGTALRASSGIETVLPLTPASSLTASAAVVDTTRGDDAADFVALAGGYEYRAGSSLVSTRYEVNFSHVEMRHLLTASGVFRLSDPWTMFVRELIYLSNPEHGGNAARAEGLFGAAYRPAVGPFQFLLRVDHTQAGGTPVTPGGVTPGGVASQPAGSIATPPRDPSAPGLGTDYARYGALAARDSVSFNFAAGFRIDSRNRLATTLIFKHAGREIGTGIPGSDTWLAAIHYTTWIKERWTLGASLRRFAQRESGQATFGEGIELGYLAMKNLWITGGYNFAGFSDSSFAGAEHTASGAFLSLRFKFDEKSLASIRDVRLDRP